MPTTPHPKFPNPTIIEALIEIEARLDPSEKWTVASPGPLIAALEADYPIFDFEKSPDITIQMTSAGLVQRANAEVTRLKFLSKDRRRLVQAHGNVFAFNFVQGYPGWEVVEPTFHEAWQKVARVAKPVEITRVGVRYINRLPRTQSNVAVSSWIKPSEYIAPAAIASSGHLLYRLETQLDERHALNLTIAQENAQPSTVPPLILDIDVVWRGAAPRDDGWLLDVVNDLHERAWVVFEKSIGVELRTILERSD